MSQQHGVIAVGGGLWWGEVRGEGLPGEPTGGRCCRGGLW